MEQEAVEAAVLVEAVESDNDSTDTTMKVTRGRANRCRFVRPFSDFYSVALDLRAYQFESANGFAAKLISQKESTC